MGAITVLLLAGLVFRIKISFATGPIGTRILQVLGLLIEAGRVDFSDQFRNVIIR